MPQKQKQVINEQVNGNEELEVVTQLTTDPLDPWDILGDRSYHPFRVAATMLSSNVDLSSLPMILNDLVDADFRDDFFKMFYSRKGTNPGNGRLGDYARNVYGSSDEEGGYYFLSHLICKNILFNTKEIYILKDSPGRDPTGWTWEIVTHQTLADILSTPNKYYIIKLDLSHSTRQIFDSFGITTSKTGYPSHERHMIPQNQYMILSSEDIGLENYYNLVPQPLTTPTPDIELRDTFFNSIDNYPIIETSENYYYHTEGVTVYNDSYSYMDQEANSDIVTESEGVDYVQR